MKEKKAVESSRKKSPEAMERELAALREKNEKLRRDLATRMGNTFQMMLSLFDMGRSRLADPDAAQIFEGVTDKIYAISLVHMAVSKSEQIENIEMGGILRQIISHLTQHYAKPGVGCILKAERIGLDIEQAVPFAIVMNELISNAFRHGFPGDEKGRIEVLMKKGEKGLIDAIVRDRGVGMSKALDIHEPKSFGLRLIHDIITKQLNGKLRIYRRNGTYIKVSFMPIRNDHNAEKQVHEICPGT